MLREILLIKRLTIQNKTRSNFMLETACQEAENVLLDQRLFQINNADYEAFEAALEAWFLKTLHFRLFYLKEHRGNINCRNPDSINTSWFFVTITFDKLDLEA